MSDSDNVESQLTAVEAVFAALAHAARRQILLVVHFRGGSMTAGEIAERFGCSWPTTSRHLRVLESAGLLAHEKHGRTRLYRIEKSKLDVVKRWFNWFEPATDKGHKGKGKRKLRARPTKPRERRAGRHH